MDDQRSPTNDLGAPVPKFCLELEKDRRTPEGRIRSERDFREHFFPYDDAKARDRLLRFMPREVRGPVIAGWGIRGRKAASRDDDARVLAVVHDAFVAGDINDQLFEEGISADILIGWGELADWWRFWRGGRHSKYSIQRALEIGYDLGLFDGRWFLEVIESGSGKLRGTDVLAEGLSKTELADWIKRIHESGDGSPKGILAALGWPTLVAKTANPVLLAVIDAFAAKNGLVKDRFLADGEDPTGASSGEVRDSADSSVVSPASFATALVPNAEAVLATGEGALAPVETPSALEEDALLRELDSARSDADSEWLDNPANATAEAADDLDVDLENAPLGEPTGAIAALLHSDDEEDSEDDEGKPSLPGLPAGLGKRNRTAPPPLPDSTPGRRR